MKRRTLLATLPALAAPCAATLPALRAGITGILSGFATFWNVRPT